MQVKKVRKLAGLQIFKLVEWIMANHPKHSERNNVEVAAIASSELGFEISESSVIYYCDELGLSFGRRPKPPADLNDLVRELTMALSNLHGRVNSLELRFEGRLL